MSQNKLWMATHSEFGFLLFLLSYFVLLFWATAKEGYWDVCPKPQRCGYLGEVGFPFTTISKPYCGFYIKGCDDPNIAKEIQLNQSWYKIDSIIASRDLDHNSFFIHYPDFDAVSSPELHEPPFVIINNITFSKCIKNANANDIHESMSIYRKCPYHDIRFRTEPNELPNFPLPMPVIPFQCLLLLQLPIGQAPIPTCPSCTFLFSILQIGLQLDKSCKLCRPGEGPCRFNPQELTCTHLNEPIPPPPAIPPYPLPPAKTQNSKTTKIGLAVGFGSVIIVALFAILLLLYKRRSKYSGIQNQPRSTYSGSFRTTTYPESGAIYFGIPVFSYEELQEATNNFDQARELGEGGFGTVYYGKLRDGREVAVKRLFERNYRPVESFINEIQILTRLRHKNLVSLYGCTSRHSRELLLVYEYIPNGTVNSHLHGDQAKPGLFPWAVRMKIAIETAGALAYLHASDIIHRDVKTSNILLDNDFGVKVADFGLSRLFPDDATHVSTAPRGTPGYVDPDYRLCYQLTTKSDVYSFGVVLAELITSLPAVDVTRNSDDIKLANLAIRKIQKRAFCELVDPSLGFQSDEKLKRMIISVAELAFQCLQGDKELRPSMGEVLKVLHRIESGTNEPGNFEGIEVQGTRASHSYAHPPLPNTLMRPHRLHQTH